MKEGILLIDKPEGKSSFSLVHQLRRLSKIKKIGHSGTLDPFATGLMVLLIGSRFTRQADRFIAAEKEYDCTLFLGKETDSYDCTGSIVESSYLVPSSSEVEAAVAHFQGEIEQLPPMFSAKKVGGRRLYQLARQKITIPRATISVKIKSHILYYQYPILSLNIICSKGTYIRSIAQDMGKLLRCGAHLSSLRRLRSGSFSIKDAIEGAPLYDPSFPHIDQINSAIISDVYQ